MIQAVDCSKYSEVSFQGLCHSMLSILHQIYIVNAPYLIPDTHLCQLQTWFFPAKPSCIQLYIKTKPSRHSAVKPGCHWLVRLWPSSSSYYPGYPMKKLTSYHKGKRPIASNRLFKLTTNRGAQRW